MRSITVISSLVFVIYLISGNALGTTISYNATDNITLMDVTSSTEAFPISNSIYIITDSTVAELTTELATSIDETTISMQTGEGSGNYSSFTTTTTITTITALTTTTNSLCNATTHIDLTNIICLPKIYVQIYTVDLLRSSTSDSATVATALSLYITSTTNANASWSPAYTLSAREIDQYLSSLNNLTLTMSSSTSFIMAQPVDQTANITTLGAFYTDNVGSDPVNDSNEYNILNSNITAAAIMHTESLVYMTFLRMFIIDSPTTYENIDKSHNTTLASAVIVVSTESNSSTSIPMNISLYFQVLDQYKPTINAIYFCSFYDLNGLQWSQSGCTQPVYNMFFNRYECNCNHLSTFALMWSPNITSCNATTEVQWTNGTCISKADAQKLASQELTQTKNSTAIANLLSVYISSVTDIEVTSNSTPTLSLADIDGYLSNITDVNLNINNSDLFLMAQQVNQSSSEITLGASYTRGIGGELINSNNKENAINLNLSAAVIISNESLNDVTSLRILIINRPSAYRYIDNSTNKTLASSIIIASVKRNNSLSTSMNISLYFQVINKWKPNTTNVMYLCSFYDTSTLQWNESGCTRPRFNDRFNRYECNCNHLTSFALLWLPNVPLTRNLDTQDIASLVFEAISILCFIAIIVHATFIRLRDPLIGLRAYELLPLISTASTTILFIFHFALGMTVYTKTTSEQQTQCFLSASVLMFLVYFFLIFMFCAKTSVGYFNYLRFVRLFPQPSYRRLFVMLIISFFISIGWVAFAIGFNSNSSFQITRLYPYKLCWFNLGVIYYFLTIPVCLFILINIILFIVVAVHIIKHVRNATSPHQSYERRKRCVIVLLSSCLTQGIGWLFGPFLTIANPTAGEVLEWVFIVFNGLEGLWVVLLYMILRSQHMDEQKHVIAMRKLLKSKKTIFQKWKRSPIYQDEDESQTRSRSAQTKSSELFDS